MSKTEDSLSPTNFFSKATEVFNRAVNGGSPVQQFRRALSNLPDNKKLLKNFTQNHSMDDESSKSLYNEVLMPLAKEVIEAEKTEERLFLFSVLEALGQTISEDSDIRRDDLRSAYMDLIKAFFKKYSSSNFEIMQELEEKLLLRNDGVGEEPVDFAFNISPHLTNEYLAYIENCIATAKHECGMEP